MKPLAGWMSLLGVVLILSGCATPEPAARTGAESSPQPEVVGVDYRLRGKVAQVHLSGEFVVLDFNLAGLPPQEMVFNVYRDNEEVGRVRINGPGRDTYISADIIEGEPQAGDEVVERVK